MTDGNLKVNYDAKTHHAAKISNKMQFQEKVGLFKNPDAPLFFWPSRLDPVQKGPQLLTDILYKTLEKYRDDNIQIAIVANGPYQQAFRDILGFHNLYGRLAVVDFDEHISRLGYASSDFTFMPSLFEPCGLPQMVAPIYGSLTIAHDTGGLHDTVEMLDVEHNKGNGFVFSTYDSQGLGWAIDRAMDFYRLPTDVREAQVGRIMTESSARFNHEKCAAEYIRIYEEMLRRPLTELFEGADASQNPFMENA